VSDEGVADGTGALRWRSWLDDPLGGATNMARDHALAESCARSGEAVLRFYGWSSPTISFGRNEPSEGLYDLQSAARIGIDFVRRPTGGRAVLHDSELTYAVAAPLDDVGRLRSWYRRINRGLVRGLADLGAVVELHETDAPAPRPDEGPCFRAPVSDEVAWNGRKLVGSAQVRLGKALLQHGSLILSGDQVAVTELRGDPPNEAPSTLAEALGTVPSLQEVSASLRAGLAEEFGGEWDAGGMSEEELDAASRWEDRYGSEAWTWRH